jgi:hypothetical protein
MGVAVVREAPVQRRQGGVWRSWVTLIVDAGLPLGGYYLLTHLGAGVTQALAITAIVPALRVIWVAARERSAEPLAMAILFVTLVSIPIALIGGSPRVLLAKESIGTGPVGLWLIIGALCGKPALTEPYRAFLVRSKAAAVAWDRRVLEDPRFRRALKFISVIWGVFALIAFAVHLLLALTLPISTAVWATGLVIPGMIVGSALGTAPLSGWLQNTLDKDVKEARS